MIVWVDAQLSPKLARWLAESLGVNATHVRELGLLSATDRVIFDAAREAGAAVLTKDADFVALVERLGPPPSILWITTGNSTDTVLRRLLLELWPEAAALLSSGIPLVEVTDRRRPAG